jgi:hypothetical protein
VAPVGPLATGADRPQKGGPSVFVGHWARQVSNTRALADPDRPQIQRRLSRSPNSVVFRNASVRRACERLGMTIV